MPNVLTHSIIFRYIFLSVTNCLLHIELNFFLFIVTHTLRAAHTHTHLNVVQYSFYIVWECLYKLCVELDCEKLRSSNFLHQFKVVTKMRVHFKSNSVETILLSSSDSCHIYFHTYTIAIVCVCSTDSKAHTIFCNVLFDNIKKGFMCCLFALFHRASFLHVSYTHA